MNEIPILYRGDSLRNTIGGKNYSSPKEKGRTWAEFYKTSGLISKFSTGGSGQILEKGLPYIVAAHIGYIKDPDPEKLNIQTLVMNKSPLISFSSQKETAYYYKDRTGKARLIKKPLSEATHFVWSLSIDPYIVKKIDSGHFSFQFKSSNQNVKEFLSMDMKKLHIMSKDPDSLNIDNFAPILGDLIASQYTENDTSDHFAEPVSYTHLTLPTKA